MLCLISTAPLRSQRQFGTISALYQPRLLTLSRRLLASYLASAGVAFGGCCSPPSTAEAVEVLGGQSDPTINVVCRARLIHRARLPEAYSVRWPIYKRPTFAATALQLFYMGITSRRRDGGGWGLSRPAIGWGFGSGSRHRHAGRPGSRAGQERLRARRSAVVHQETDMLIYASASAGGGDLGAVQYQTCQTLLAVSGSGCRYVLRSQASQGTRERMFGSVSIASIRCSGGCSSIRAFDEIFTAVLSPVLRTGGDLRRSPDYIILRARCLQPCGSGRAPRQYASARPNLAVAAQMGRQLVLVWGAVASRGD